MKSRKRLSVFLAASMTLSAFAPVAFGAELTTEQKWQALVDAGIFDADGTGQGAQLDANMTRAQFTKVIVKLLGLQEVSDTPSFDDVKGHWAAGYIEAAKRAGLVDGVSDNPPLFAPDNEVTLEQLAKLVVEALDLEQSTDAVSGKVSDWAKGYVAAAVKAGLLPASSDYTVPAKREVLVTATYQAREIEEGKKVTKIESFKAVGAKKLEVKFSKAVDKSKAQISVKKGVNTVTVASVTFAEDGKSAVIETASKLTKGEYTITVSNVEQTALEAKATVDDEKVAKMAFTSDKAPYDRTLAEDNDNTNDNTAIIVTLKIYNQYGEDVTGSYIGEVQPYISASKGQPDVVDTKAGKIKITSPVGYNLNETVYVNAVHASTGTYVSQAFTVSLKATVADISIVKFVSEENKKLETTSDPSKFWFEVEAKDQYGNPLGPNEIEKDVIVSVSNPSGLGFKKSGNNPDFEDKDGKAILRLEAGSGVQAPEKFAKGSYTIYMISRYSGKQASMTIEVSDIARLDTLSLSTPDRAVKGEEIEIPFTATDQYGNAINDADKLNGGFLSLSVSALQENSNQSLPLTFKQDYVNNKVKLILDARNARNKDQAETVFIAGTTKTGKSFSFSFTLQKAKVPVSLVKVEGLKTGIALGATTELKAENVKIEDQYGKQWSLNDFSGYRVRVTVSNANVTSSAYALAPNGSVTLTGATAGEANVNVELWKQGDFDETTGQPGSGKQAVSSLAPIRVRVVQLSDIADYKVGDVAKLYTSTDSSYAKDLSVTGVLADGTEVALPTGGVFGATEYYKVNTGVTWLTFDNGKLKIIDANAAKSAVGNDNEKSYSVTVIGYTKDTPKTYVKSVTVSKVDPAPETLALKDYTVSGNVIIKKENDTTVSIKASDLNNPGTIADKTTFLQAVEIKDQYGVVMPLALAGVQVYDSNYSDSDRLTDNPRTFDAGDSFYITVVTTNAKTLTFKVQVVN